MKNLFKKNLFKKKFLHKISISILLSFLFIYIMKIIEGKNEQSEIKISKYIKIDNETDSEKDIEEFTTKGKDVVRKRISLGNWSSD